MVPSYILLEIKFFSLDYKSVKLLSAPVTTVSGRNKEKNMPNSMFVLIGFVLSTQFIAFHR